MFKKSLLLVVLAALFLVGCTPAAPAAAPANYGAAPTGLSVNGRGQVTLAPDVAYVTIGVHTTGADVSEAVNANAAQVAEVMEALGAAGVAQEDMQTSNFSVYASEGYDPSTGLSTGVSTYTVDNTVNVTARDLPNLGALLDAAVSAGANNIWGVTFDVENKDAALAEARDAALAEAQTNATELAAAAGVTLGDVVSISYTDTGYYAPPYYGMGGGGGGADAGTSIVPGQITVSAEVYLTYAIR
jgi:uncharacterized protein YggE